MRKIQVPAIGGLRKVIKFDPGSSANPGTTIAEFANQVVTIAQLKFALGITTPTSGGSGGGTNTGALVLGPGLAGGGPLLGAVPLYMQVPIPYLEEDRDDPFVIPGPQGAQGVQGLQGPPGQALEPESEREVILVPQSPQRVVKSATWPAPGSPNLVFVYCPQGGSIMAVRLMTEGGPGSCVVDILKKPFGSFPPAGGDSITAAAIPTISSGITYEDTTLTGWTRRINAGDVLAFKLTSSSTFTSVHVSLEVQE